ncbi:kinase-like domain-containing protein [Dichotomocladium elegans]|nr:kinase-like domain-containing protein [Dichotomocladium elegans]
MSVCLASIGNNVYAFVGSQNAIHAHQIDKVTTDFNEARPAYNISVPGLEISSTSLNLCAIADSKLFILGGFGKGPGIMTLSLNVYSTPNNNFGPTYTPITTNDSSFLIDTASFTVFVGEATYCAIFSSSSKVSKVCFDPGQAFPIQLGNEGSIAPGSVLGTRVSTPGLEDVRTLYDLTENEIKIYGLNTTATVINTSPALNVTGLVNGIGQLYPISINPPTEFSALLTIGSTLYFVGHNTGHNNGESTGESTGQDTEKGTPRGADLANGDQNPTTENDKNIPITELKLSLPDKTMQYTYIYANKNVFFAGATGGGSFSLDSLLDSASASPSTLAGPSSTDTQPADASSAPSPNNNAGAIAGGVVGGVVVLAIIGALFFCYKRRKRHQARAYSLSADKEKLSLNDASHKEDPLDNATHYDTIILPAQELQALDPLASSSASVFGGAYSIPDGEKAVLVSPSSMLVQNYAARPIHRNEEVFTLHYFGPGSRTPFLRNVAVTRAISQSNAVVRTVEAFQTQKPIKSKAGLYQYLWITSPATLPTQSLEYLLQSPGLFDVSDIAFRAWSTLTLLEAVRDLHGAGYVHLDLRPIHFYYPDPDQVDRWKLAGFECAVKPNTEIDRLGPNAYQAPELSNPHAKADPSADIWSLGWVIFYLLTGEGPIPDENAAIERVDQIDGTYGTLLGHMLLRDPEKRYTALQLAEYWKEAQNMEDDT